MIALALAGLLALNVASLEAPRTATIVTIESKVLGERRDVWIDAPPACTNDARCDVLYVLDADALFPLASAFATVMNSMGRMPSIIVVGIPSRSTDDRIRNFTAGASDEERLRYPAAGGASRFMDFLQNEVPAAIASRVPAGNRRIIAGHSLAGLFAIGSLTADRGWDGAIAISPTLGWNRGSAIAEAGRWVSTAKPAAKQLYVSIADGDTDVYRQSFAHLQQAIVAAGNASPRTTMDKRSGEDHVTTIAPALQHAMLWFFGK